MRAWLGLGGNLGDVRRTLRLALDLLDGDPAIAVMRVSALYRTPPWGKADQPAFLNACAEVATLLSPRQLLARCLAVERRLGRFRRERWGPRTLDIDILAADGPAISSPGLMLPHPRLTERAFVLVPLGDIAPDLMIAGKTIAGWRAGLDAKGIDKLDAPGNWWRPRRRPGPNRPRLGPPRLVIC